MIGPYKMLMWSTDDAGRVVALIEGKSYTHDETVRLFHELSWLLESEADKAEPGSMVAHITRMRRAGQPPVAT